MAETDCLLGVLPLGTANDLARTLGLPTDPLEAAKTIIEGKRRRIDLGRVNDKHFLQRRYGLGLTVKITRELSQEVKSRWGVLAYPLTAFRVLWNHRSFHAEIRANGETHRVHAMQIAVGNGRYYGGGMTIADDAAIDDGLLDLYSLEVHRWWQVMSLVPALRAGTHAGKEGVRVLRGSEFGIRTRRPRHINTDGEITTQTPQSSASSRRAIEICAGVRRATAVSAAGIPSATSIPSLPVVLEEPRTQQAALPSRQTAYCARLFAITSACSF
ncbi:MAG: lipid kinase [Gemmataceae bacterium]